jgi:acetyltransferase
MAIKNLEKLLIPKSISIIGASRDTNKIGNIVLKNIIDFGFKGHLYPINPNAQSILGLKCYPSIDSVVEKIDLAIISLPAELALISIEKAAQKGIKDFIVFSAGFKESGNTDREEKLLNLAKKYKINLLGPNCLGLVSHEGKINATFGQVDFRQGNLRFLSQSGAIATSVFDWASTHNIGFSDFITLGNKSVLDDTDFLKYWLNNPIKNNQDNELSPLNPIGIYAESINDGIDFINIISQVTLENPVFILKPGRHEYSQKAMQSHTGSMAGEDKVFDAILKDSGVIRCDGIEDFFDLAKAFSWEDTPKGNEIVIISNAGGPAVTATDFLENYDLKLGEISEKTKLRLKKYLPQSANIHNPIDVLGDALANRYAESLDATLSQQNISAAIVILTPQVMTESYLTAQYISRLSKLHKKPIICSFMGGKNISEGEKLLNNHKIPNFRYPERAIKALGEMWKWQKSSTNRKTYLNNIDKYQKTDLNLIKQGTISEIIDIVRNSDNATNEKGHKAMNSFEVEEIFLASNIKIPPSAIVQTFEDALEFTKTNGWPVVMKIISDKLLHKSDIGGVQVNLNNRNKLKTAYSKLNNIIEDLPEEIKNSCSIQIQKQIDKGIELIIGVKKDENYGHMMMFGAGGTMAEILDDVNLKSLPIDIVSAYELVKSSKIKNLFDGFRGEKKYNLEKLYFLMKRLSDLVIAFPEFEEIEINPVILTYDDIWAVDGKAIIS